MTDIVDDVLNGCKSKNPQVKEGTLKFLLRSLQTTTDAPGKDQIKPMAEALVVLLGDSAEPVRSSAAECLGTMMKILGERTFNPYVEKVPELQMAKVKDAFARAEIKYKAGGGKAPVSKPAASAPVKKVSKHMSYMPDITAYDKSTCERTANCQASSLATYPGIWKIRRK
jgi:cytoskeleton-associated protein 5